MKHDVNDDSCGSRSDWENEILFAPIGTGCLWSLPLPLNAELEWKKANEPKRKEARKKASNEVPVDLLSLCVIII